MKNYSLLFGLSLLLICINAVETTAENRIVFKEDFEGGGKLTPWAENGAVEVNFAGPTSEMSYSGKQSFKIDFTWKSSTYNYWWSLPINVPFYGHPTLKGKIYVKEGNAQLGFAWADPATGTSGNVMRAEKLSETQKEGWTEFTLSARAANSYDLSYVMGIGLFMYKPVDSNRTVVYIDDLEVSADLAPDWAYMFNAKLEEIKRQKEEGDKRIKQTMGRDVEELSQISDSFKKIKELPQTALWIQKHKDKLRNYVTDALPRLESQFKSLNQSFSINGLINARHSLKLLENAVISLESINQFVEKYPELPYLIYIVPPVSDNKVVPDSFPVPGVIGNELKLSACTSEYEPASFVIYSQQKLENVVLKATPLRNKNYTIPAKEVDIRIVKCWWQAGDTVDDVIHPVLTPELLLKNPNLVIVNNEKKRNTVDNPKSPQDTKDLQPVTIPEKTNQQFWITVHIPAEAKPGRYQGNIEVKMDNAPPIILPISVEVLPFKLEDPVLEYAIYYHYCPVNLR